MGSGYMSKHRYLKPGRRLPSDIIKAAGLEMFTERDMETELMGGSWTAGKCGEPSERPQTACPQL